MALSDKEEDVLRELENLLHKEDPRFANSFRKGRVAMSGRLLLASAGGFLLGLSALLGGVAFKSVILGISGFALMLIAVLLLGHTMRTANSAKPAKTRVKRKSVFDVAEERWRKRNEGS